MSATVAEETAISVSSLRKSFTTEEVLCGIDLHIESGEFCVVVGPSGSGKSTLLKCIVGLLDYDDGWVTLNGKDVESVPVEDRNLGYVFQDFEERLFPHMTVEENVAFGLRNQEDGPSDSEINERITSMLELLAISETRDNAPGELSGGQQQRVELARQLVRRCDVMLLDDPLADLDYKLQKRMELEMRRIHEELDSTFLYVTHNQDQALKLADKLVVMNHGMIEQVGPPDEVYDNPNTAFVGRFVGDSNPLLGDVVEARGERVAVETNAGRVLAKPRGDSADGNRVLIITRPEELVLGRGAMERDNAFDARIESRTYTGETTEFVVAVEGLKQEFEVVVPGNVGFDDLDRKTKIGWNAEQGIAYDQLSVSDAVAVDDLIEV